MQRYGGISRYFCELMNQLSIDVDLNISLGLQFSNNENLLAQASLNKYWSNNMYDNSHLLTALNVPNRSYNNSIILKIINQHESTRILKKQNYDIFHPTYYNPYFLKHLKNKPFILTIHDMIHELYPDSFSFFDRTKTWKSQLIKRADQIIAISESTKKDIIKLYDIDPNLIHVVYHGNPLEETIKCVDEHNEIDTSMINRRYILFVGNREGYKNFPFLCASISQLINKEKNLFLYCAGGQAFTPMEISLFEEHNIKSKVCHIKPNDCILKQLYKNAEAFIFPSLYEGFGLPILEAFSCGCPTILSNTSSFPEIGGNAAIYFDPKDQSSLSYAIDAVLFDTEYRDILITKGFDRVKDFSWSESAKKTKKIYESILYL